MKEQCSTKTIRKIINDNIINCAFPKEQRLSVFDFAEGPIYFINSKYISFLILEDCLQIATNGPKLKVLFSDPEMIQKSIEFIKELK